jgi:TonB family protein
MKFAWKLLTAVMLCLITGCSALPAKNAEKPHLLQQGHYVYPKSSRYNGETGKVVLELMVKPDGTTGAIKVRESSTFPALDEAAIAGARSTRFNPLKQPVNGSPLRRALLPVQFSLIGPDIDETEGAVPEYPQN